MRNLLFLIMLFVTGCKSLETKHPYSYRIVYPNTNKITYTNKITNSTDYHSSVIIYKFVNTKYVKIIF